MEYSIDIAKVKALVFVKGIDRNIS